MSDGKNAGRMLIFDIEGSPVLFSDAVAYVVVSSDGVISLGQRNDMSTRNFAYAAEGAAEDLHKMADQMGLPRAENPHELWMPRRANGEPL